MVGGFRARGYQQAAVDAVMHRHAEGARRLLLYLPTGSGKTVIGALVIERMLARRRGTRTLFIAHRPEILDQTAAVLRRHMPQLQVGIEQGDRRAAEGADVTVASVQSLVRRRSRFDPGAFGLVVCDECHRALAPTWAEVIGYFHDHHRDHHADGGLLLGMTATPRRTDGRSVLDVFDEIAFEISLTELQDLGFLVPMRYFSVQADLNLATVGVAAGDFQVGSLGQVMNTPGVRALTLRAWQERGAGRKTIAFCAGVGHARQLAADFEALCGVRAVVVDAKTKDRNRLLGAFRAGEIQVLTNYGVLVEGFDDPAIECVLMVRPTKSPLVYTQCLGRGLRVAPGKHNCTVIDVVDRSTHQLQYGMAHMSGLPRRWRSKGRDPFRERRSVGAIRVSDPDAFLRIQAATSLEDVQQILMELPPHVVQAGLDGEPVPRYTPATERPPASRARRDAHEILSEAGASVRTITADEETLKIHLRDPEVDNERYAYLRWHLQRVTQRAIEFQRPAQRRLRSSSPRAVLRSMLGGRRIHELAVDPERQLVDVTIAGLGADEADALCRNFEREVGMQLRLTGQLGLGF
ncbi:MAG: DEAD/DEAH box helicase [Myxococcota bacterium]